jgi:vesicle-fusing ATPase
MATPAKPATKVPLKITKLPSDELALTNKVFVSPEDYKVLKGSASALGDFVMLKDFVFSYAEHKSVPKGLIGLSSVQRRFVLVSLNEPIDAIPFVPTGDAVYIGSINLEVDYLSKNKKGDEFKSEDINKLLLRDFVNQFFTVEQRFVVDLNGVNLEFRVKGLENVNLASLAKGDETAPVSEKAQRGILHHKSGFVIEKAPGSALKILGGNNQAPTLFRPKWNFESMGIGGLDKEFSDIFRRAFASRVFPPEIIQKLGIKHVKGMLLYGPPGTGKTLMARQIGKMLNGKEPVVVNGPEILNKYVGQSEENIRNLFKAAELEYKEKGDFSDLHIIIFDEIDAICKQRGSRNDGTGVQDTVVNQLLAKIDGVDALNNILVIGMTNRKDLIDEALLRPGRLEVHMEISLPDEKGRLQILKIHTSAMRNNNSLGEDVDLEDLATRTKNFSGAEIEGLVKSATSFALNRQVDVSDGVKVKDSDIKVIKVDFDRALDEVTPAFGVDEQEFENCIRNGIINYGPKVEKLLHSCSLYVQQVKNSNRTPLVSILLEGTVGSGKTALAAKIATESGYPYVKLISPETLIGYSEVGRCNKITKIFEDSYKSPLSCIVVDDIERLLDYVRIGPRFSNAVLQTLAVLLKKEPPTGKRLLIISTTSNHTIMQDLELLQSFHSLLEIPVISTPEEFRKVLNELKIFDSTIELDQATRAFSAPIAIKKLIMATEMARQGTSGSVVERFLQCMSNFS